MQEDKRDQQRDARDKFFTLSLELLCIVDFGGRFVQLNPMWEKTLGYKLSYLLGRPFTDFVHPEDIAASASEAGRLLTSGGETISFENRYRHADGGYRWFRWSAVGNLDDHLIYAIATDITEQKRVERMKNEFISTVSHELRTPLTAMRGALGLILGGYLGEIPTEVRTTLEIIGRNSDSLTYIINDILDLEKMESGRMEYCFGAGDLAAAVSESITDIQPYADRFNVTVVLSQCPLQAPATFDPSRIKQVLNNLLSNAIKFSPEHGQVQVTVDMHDSDYRVTIQDQGPGIPENFHSRLFQRFAQADSSDSRRKGGTGLGLCISKTIIEHHSGQIGFETAMGHGSTFYFDLPHNHT